MEIAMLIIGLLLGGSICTALLCCMQVSRINGCQREIHKLRSQLEKKE